MKVIRILIASMMLIAAAVCAHGEQLLPDVSVFSPGLIRLSEKMAQAPAVHMEAAISVTDAFYVRDTSVLSSMLEGTTFVYDGVQSESGAADRLKIVRGGETLFSGVLSGEAVAVNGETFLLDKRERTRDEAVLQSVLDFAQRTAILERAPLDAVEAFLLAFDEGDALLGDYAVVEPFSSERTMSDDGTRLTRINIQGSIAREGEAPWVIKGYMKQPAGRAPKDTFELTATRDDKNWLELSYSSLRQSEITKKNRSGKNNVDTHVKIAGEIGGYRVSERLTSYLRNTWTADGEKLNERIVVSMTLEHGDNTPGREMQRMNKAEAKMRSEIRMTTADAGNDVIDLTDALTISLVMDENTVLDAAADMTIAIGGEVAAISAAADEQTSGEDEIPDALEQAAQRIAHSVFAQLDEKTQNKVLKDLE